MHDEVRGRLHQMHAVATTGFRNLQASLSCATGTWQVHVDKRMSRLSVLLHYNILLLHFQASHIDNLLSK